MNSGVEIIAAERARQVQSEGYDELHDDSHKRGALARAGACYAIPAPRRNYRKLWPWPGCFKPRPDDRIRELAKAGALIAAEIDLLLRKTERDAERKAMERNS